MSALNRNSSSVRRTLHPKFVSPSLNLDQESMLNLGWEAIQSLCVQEEYLGKLTWYSRPERYGWNT